VNGQAVIPGNGMTAVHNTQPWRFGHGERQIDVYADAGRRLRVADPAGRELMMSCGAALFTLRVALRYLGWLPHARLFPDPSRPALVARVSWDEDPIAADPYEREMYAAVTARYTHRGGFGPAPLPTGTLAALRAEAARERAMFRLVPAGDQRDALAAAVQAAEHALRLDGRRAADRRPGSSHRTARATTASRPPPTRPSPPIPSRTSPAVTSPPGRAGAGHPGRGRALFGGRCLLPTSANEPADWIAAGQALQRVLLRAACGVAAALHSQPLELPQLRDFIRVQLAARAHPQLIIRLGVTAQAGAGTGSVRRPVGEVLL
jgi:hypothetical protein